MERVDYERLWFRVRHWAEENGVEEVLARMREIEGELMCTFSAGWPFMVAWFRLRNSDEGRANSESLREFEKQELRSEDERLEDMMERMQEAFKSLGQGFRFGELPGEEG